MNSMPAQNQRILIVEDDESIAALLEQGLARWGYQVLVAPDFADVLQSFVSFAPDLVLLDISLPVFNGYYWCTRIREKSNTPIVFLSSANEDIDIVMAMQMGGDDYITKPFSMTVLLAKIQAVLRRSRSSTPAEEQYALGNAAFDAASGCIWMDESSIELTKNESRILHLLLSNRGKIVTRDEIMLKLWNSESFIDENTLTVNINRLRKKLDACGLEGFINTRRGEGYIIQ